MNVTNTQSLASFTTFANGTIFFLVSGFELSQVTYRYTVVSYGNGTFVLRFAGIVPYQISTSTSATAGYDYSNKWEQFTFTSSATDTSFSVTYGGARLQIGNGITFATGLLALFVILVMVTFFVFIMAWFKNKATPDAEEEGLSGLIKLGIGLTLIALVIGILLATISIIGGTLPV